MFHKVKNVKVLKEYLLEVEFQNNITKYYNVGNLFEKWTIFQELQKDKELFKQVKIDNGGYGISWNEEIDLSCDELWENGFSKL